MKLEFSSQKWVSATRRYFYKISPISVYLLGRGTKCHSSHTSICLYNKHPCNTETVAPCRDMEGMFDVQYILKTEDESDSYILKGSLRKKQVYMERGKATSVMRS